jgi:hypothetical protein
MIAERRAGVAARRGLVDATVAVVVDSVARLGRTGDGTERRSHVGALVVAVARPRGRILPGTTGLSSVTVVVAARPVVPIAVLVDVIAADLVGRRRRDAAKVAAPVAVRARTLGVR